MRKWKDILHMTLVLHLTGVKDQQFLDLKITEMGSNSIQISDFERTVLMIPFGLCNLDYSQIPSETSCLDDIMVGVHL